MCVIERFQPNAILLSTFSSESDRKIVIGQNISGNLNFKHGYDLEGFWLYSVALQRIWKTATSEILFVMAKEKLAKRNRWLLFVCTPLTV